MKNVRIWFEKKGPARYISHLDVTRCMTRAIRLGKLPVWYTEGFNPRVYMAFAMPLSLGVVGARECMDIRLTEELPLTEVARRLGEHLPEGLPVLKATEPAHRLEEVAYADYRLCFADTSAAALSQALGALLRMDTVPVMKHTKKGPREMDVKPYLAALMPGDDTEAGCYAAVRLPTSTAGSVNPALLIEALHAQGGLTDAVSVTREKLLLPDYSEFS